MEPIILNYNRGLRAMTFDAETMEQQQLQLSFTMQLFAAFDEIYRSTCCFCWRLLKTIGDYGFYSPKCKV